MSSLKEDFDGEYYHVYNRGILKQNIFLDSHDYTRFLFLILFFQSPTTFSNIGRPVNSFVRSSTFNIDDKDIISNRFVELTAFALMPNHIHLLVKETKENSLARYMHRINTSYTKYFNTKHQQNGHLFQSRYKSTLIDDNDQLLYVSAYIHKNPKTLKGWQTKFPSYPWSSHRDYSKQNRWGNLLSTDLIIDQFKNQKEYHDWVLDTTAKELEQFNNEK